MSGTRSRLRVLEAIVLSLALCGGASAQTTASSENPVALAPDDIRPFSLVTDEGLFKNKFDTFKEVDEASRGNAKNRIIKDGIELIYLNSRCNPADGVSYSFTGTFRAGIDVIVKRYFDKWAADPDARGNEEQALVDEVQRALKAKYFPRKAECDAIPMMLSIGNYDGILLESDDAQNPLVGTKLNDGMMYAGVTEDNPFADRVRAGEQDPNFLNKYGYNRFFDAQTAVNGALLQKTKNKLLIYDGTKISLYKFGNFSPDYNKKGAEFDAQFDIFKKAKVRKGWTIIAVVLGQDRAIKINDPVAP